MNATRYRIAVVVWYLIYAWWSVFPYSNAYKQPAFVRDAMQHIGRGAILPPSDWLADGFLLAMFAAAIGLFLFYRWGRTLFVATSILGVAVSFGSGVGVSGPIDGTIAYFMTLLHGALVALSFSPPIAQKFTGEEAKVEPELVAIHETAKTEAAEPIHSLLTSASIDYTSKTKEGRVQFFVRPADEVTAKDVLQLSDSERRRPGG